MNKFWIFKILLFLGTFFCISCTKNGCDDCTLQKEAYCKAMYEVNCNGAMLTTHIDNLVKACGTTEANQFISETTTQCTQGNLNCSNNCQ